MLLIVGFAVLLLVPNAQALGKQHPDGNLTRAEPHVSPMAGPKIVPIDFDVVNENYGSLLGNLHHALTDNAARRIRDVPVLPPQRTNHKPARWIYVKLTGTNGDKTTIAIRDDNIYLVGFTNQTGDWYIFKNRQGLIPGATPLGFEDSYRDLVGDGGVNRLPHNSVSKLDAINAVRNLAYQRSPHHLEQELRLPLARLTVMIAEAERFHNIFNTVSQGWESKETYIDASDAARLVLWGKTSKALINYDRTKKWVDKGGVLAKNGITGPSQAVAMLRVLLQPKPPTSSASVDPQTEACNVTCN